MNASPVGKMKADVDVDVDVEDDISMCFRSKRKSTANVVYDDDEMPRRRKGRRKEMLRREEGNLWNSLWQRLMHGSRNVTNCPLCGAMKKAMSTIPAALLEIDGPWLKEADKGDYEYVLNFASECPQKRCLQLFHHPGDPRIGGLGSDTGKKLDDDDRDLAVVAIKQYQKLNQNVKLQLRDLMKLNYSIGNGLYYVTFSAEDEMTGEIKTYQAALAEYFYQYLLGLFRDLVDDKILAILSVKGTEEDLAQLMRMNLGGCVKKDKAEQRAKEEPIRMRRVEESEEESQEKEHEFLEDV